MTDKSDPRNPTGHRSWGVLFSFCIPLWIVFTEFLENKKENEFKQKIFFDGQIYDLYSKIIDIMSIAKNELINLSKM